MRRSAGGDPELAVLSAISHGRDADVSKSVRIAAAAQRGCAGLDADRAELYFDFIMVSLSEIAQREWRNMDLSTYEYQSEFARRYVAQGRNEGRAEGEAEGSVKGRAALVRRLLEVRFGALPESAQAQIAAASIAELDAIGERLLTAGSLQEALTA